MLSLAGDGGKERPLFPHLSNGAMELRWDVSSPKQAFRKSWHSAFLFTYLYNSFKTQFKPLLQLGNLPRPLQIWATYFSFPQFLEYLSVKFIKGSPVIALFYFLFYLLFNYSHSHTLFSSKVRYVGIQVSAMPLFAMTSSSQFSMFSSVKWET